MTVTREQVDRAIRFQDPVHADSRAGTDLLAVIALLLLEIREELKTIREINDLINDRLRRDDS